MIESPKPKYYPFSFAKMNKYYLLPFILPIVCFFTKFCTEPMKEGPEKKRNDINEDVEHTFVFIYTLINSISHIIGGLLYFISLLKSQSQKTKLVENTEGSKSSKKKDKLANNIYDAILMDKKEDKYRKLKITSILFGMAFILTVYNMIKGFALNRPQLEKRLYFLFFFTIFNKCLFKKKAFLHQKLSLGIAALGMGILFYLYFYYLQYSEYNYIYDILLFFGSFFYSLYLVLVKYLTLNYGMSPFLVILLIGLFSTELVIIGYCSFSYINNGDLSYILNIFNCTDSNYVCFGNFYLEILIYLIINSVLQVLIFLVIYFFSPEVYAISDIISPMLLFIYKYIINKLENKDINILSISLNILGYFIVLLGALIYNEIIVCNFCGLNLNTWKVIGLRGNDELNRNTCNDSNTVDSYLIENSSKGESFIEMS